MKLLVRKPALYEAPKGSTPPPLVDPRPADLHLHRRVSFAHGSNDGQKGMGLIMLILIGMVPTAYALNRAVPTAEIAGFVERSRQRRRPSLAAGGRRGAAPADPRRGRCSDYVRTRSSRPTSAGAGRADRTTSPTRSSTYGSLAKVPAAAGQQRPQRHVSDRRGDPPRCKKDSADLAGADTKALDGLSRRRSTTRPSSSRSG